MHAIRQRFNPSFQGRIVRIFRCSVSLSDLFQSDLSWAKMQPQWDAGNSNQSIGPGVGFWLKQLIAGKPEDSEPILLQDPQRGQPINATAAKVDA